MKRYLWIILIFMANTSIADGPVTGVVNTITVTVVSGSVTISGAAICTGGFNFNLGNDALFSILNSSKTTSLSASPKAVTLFYDNDTDCNITHINL